MNSFLFSFSGITLRQYRRMVRQEIERVQGDSAYQPRCWGMAQGPQQSSQWEQATLLRDGASVAYRGGRRHPHSSVGVQADGDGKPPNAVQEAPWQALRNLGQIWEWVNHLEAAEGVKQPGWNRTYSGQHWRPRRGWRVKMKSKEVWHVLCILECLYCSWINK